MRMLLGEIRPARVLATHAHALALQPAGSEHQAARNAGSGQQAARTSDIPAAALARRCRAYRAGATNFGCNHLTSVPIA